MSKERERARERTAVFHFMVVIVDNGLQLIYSSTINENQVIEMVQFPSPFLTPLTLVLSSFSSSFTKKALRFTESFCDQVQNRDFSNRQFHVFFATRNAMCNKSMCVQCTYTYQKRQNAKRAAKIKQYQNDTSDGFVAMWKYEREPVPSYSDSFRLKFHVIRVFSCAKRITVQNQVSECVCAPLCRL